MPKILINTDYAKEVGRRLVEGGLWLAEIMGDLDTLGCGREA